MASETIRPLFLDDDACHGILDRACSLKDLLQGNGVVGFPSAEFDELVIDQVIEQGDKVVARWTSTMTHQGEFLGFPATGKKATITGTSIQRVSNGKIVEGWDNWDQLGLLVQIGVVPAAHFVKPAERRSA